MGLFNGRKYNSTYFSLMGNGNISQEVVTGLINRTIEVLSSHNCKIDWGTKKKRNGCLEYKLIGGGKVAFDMFQSSRLDIALDSPLSKAEFSNVVDEIDQYPASLGLFPNKDYWGLNHY